MESGVVAFITNNSYLDAKQDDGFRACVRQEFDYAYFVDLQGNSRLNGEEAKIQGGNIFNIRVGVGIMFLIKNGDNQGRCDIKYTSVDDYATREQKLSFLSQMYVAIPDLSLRTYNNLVGTFDKITPNDKNQWLGLVENDWQSLIPLISKECKNDKTNINHPHLTSTVKGEEQKEYSSTSPLTTAVSTSNSSLTSPLTGEVAPKERVRVSTNKAIFKLYSLGVATNRDKWVYDVDANNLQKKVKKFIQIYDQEMQTKQAEIERLNSRDKAKVKDTQEKTNGVDLEHRQFEYALTQKIKWSRDLKKDFIRKIELKFDKNNIKQSLYRPFVKKYIYYGHGLNDVPGHFPKIFPSDVVENRVISFDTRSVYGTIITDGLLDLHTNGDSIAIPLHTFADGVTKMPNLTDFGRQVFVDHIKNISHPHLASPVEGEGKKEASTSPLTGEVALQERVRVSEKFIQRSRELRKKQTEAEAKFWSVCRNNNLGFKFRRQQTIDNTYIADFVCLDKKLIIELDGGQHCESKYDEKRDKYLMQNDFRVVRFWNDEILNNIDGCIEVVLIELSHPHLASPVKGEGAFGKINDATVEEEGKKEASTSPLTGEVGELGSSGEGALDSLIFYYCYAILSSTRYKQKYKENLKVDLPRIPLLKEFFKLSKLGKQLADLHINYETAPKHNLELFEIPQKIHANNKDLVATDFKPNIALKVDKTKGEVKLDEKHILRGIPAAAFEYKIGNKSPIEWVCSDNCFAPLKYDKTENEQFLAQIDDYNWSEVKAKLIDLIPRLVTVSLETAKIIADIDLSK